MRKLVLLCAIVAVTACSQPEGPAETGAVSEVCGNLQDDIKQLQYGTADSLAELTREVLANGDDPTSYDRRKEIENRFHIRLNNVLALMDGHKCEMPGTVPSAYAYSQAARNCAQARSSSLSGAEEACNQELWEVDQTPQEALENSVLAEDGPSPSKSEDQE